MKFTLIVVVFVAVIILGFAFFMTHNVNMPTVNATQTVNTVCNAVQSLCTSK